MPEHRTAGEIRAAGAVLWQPAGSGTRVALVHRPKYDDWGFAKGKLEPGEHVLLAAVREVAEETGLPVTLGRRLPPVRYEGDGVPKRVDYWAAEVDPDGRGPGFSANAEIDEVRWLAASAAAGQLSYRRDAETLADFRAGPHRTVPLILVRHASAGRKPDWHSSDETRPLDGRGKKEARFLALLLRCFGVSRVVSSPATAVSPRSAPTPAAWVSRSRPRPRSSPLRVPGGAGARIATPSKRRRLRRRPRRPARPSPRWRLRVSRLWCARTGRTCRRCWRARALNSARSDRRTSASRCARASSWCCTGQVAAWRRSSGTTSATAADA